MLRAMFVGILAATAPIQAVAANYEILPVPGGKSQSKNSNVVGGVLREEEHRTTAHVLDRDTGTIYRCHLSFGFRFLNNNFEREIPRVNRCQMITSLPTPARVTSYKFSEVKITVPTYPGFTEAIGDDYYWFVVGGAQLRACAYFHKNVPNYGEFSCDTIVVP